MMKRAFVMASAIALSLSIASIATPAAAIGGVCPKPQMGKEYIPGTCVYQRANEATQDKARAAAADRQRAEKAASAKAAQAARDARKAERATRKN